MMNNLYILKIEKVSNLTNLANRAIHNFRKIPTAAPNADINKRYLNTVLVNAGIEDYSALWRDRQYEVNMEGGYCKPRKDSVYAYEIVLGYSHGAIADDKVMKWAEANVKWLGEAFGGDKNVLSAVLHMDETTPHIHAIVIPIDERNRLCAKSFTGGKKKMFRLRDSYTKAMEQLGLEAPIRYTKADNYELKKFYRAVNTIVNTPAPEKGEEETEEEFIDRCESWVKNIEFKTMDETRKAERKINRLLAQQEVYNVENKQAHHLTNVLMMKYCGNKKRAKKTILQFSEFVDNVPVDVLERTMDFLEEKFVKGENLLGKEKSSELIEINQELEQEDKEVDI
jgi:hypothetical protein